MFNIILPKPCEFFAKFVLEICQNLAKISQGFSTNTILAHSDRMIYFRENSNVNYCKIKLLQMCHFMPENVSIWSKFDYVKY